MRKNAGNDIITVMRLLLPPDNNELPRLIPKAISTKGSIFLFAVRFFTITKEKNQLEEDIIILG